MLFCLATSFFLGILFSFFPYDYPALWTSAPPSPAYFDMLETHLRFIHSSPAIIPRILHIVVAVGILGFLIKLYKPSEANVLFDGASLILYVIAITVYVSNIVAGLRVVTEGVYGAGDPEVVGREDTLKVLAASNTILALVLIGVLVLQAGQWYAERKEGEEAEQYTKQDELKATAKATGAHKTPSGKKKAT